MGPQSNRGCQHLQHGKDLKRSVWGALLRTYLRYWSGHFHLWLAAGRGLLALKVPGSRFGRQNGRRSLRKERDKSCEWDER